MRILTGVGHICCVEVNSLGVNISNHHQTLKHQEAFTGHQLDSSISFSLLKAVTLLAAEDFKS